MSGSADSSAEPQRADHETSPATVGEYSWADFLRTHGYGHAVDDLYRDVDARPDATSNLVDRVLGRSAGVGVPVPTAADWERVDIDPTAYLGFHPTNIEARLRSARLAGVVVRAHLNEWLRRTPVTKGAYGWEHFKLEYHYDERGGRPRDDDGRIIPFDPSAYLGFDPAHIAERLAAGMTVGVHLQATEERRTVNVDPDVDEDEFFSSAEGHTTVTNRYDLEKAVPMARKPHLDEVERYWVDKPYAFVIIFHSIKENEKKYYLVSPHLNTTEAQLKSYLTSKLRTTIKYADDVVVHGTVKDRIEVIQRELRELLYRFDLIDDPASKEQSVFERARGLVGEGETLPEQRGELDGIAARPEPTVVAEDAPVLTAYQVEKLEYLLLRDFIGFERIDGIKHDVNVEDISCDGYDSPVFVYHSEYEQLITNVAHERDDLDRFVVKLAQRSGKSISKRHPQVDATLPDGSRAQLTLGREVSAHGTNYTIRQFNDVPFTPVDLVNWHTFSLDELVFLWLAIENNKSILFAGGTASGKTTSLNAMSLFIPSSAKIVSIEDTREVELPQRNWVASVTRPSFSHNDDGDIDEFDLLEASLRQRPEYILMGEVRGEEGRTLFQVMSTGHTTLTTFHADSVAEVLKRFTTDPINVSKTMFTALDLVSVQTQTRVKGQKIRRNKVITEINRYDAERDEINVRDLYQWRPDSDEFTGSMDSNLLAEIQFDRGWTDDELGDAMYKRRVVLAYLVKHGLNEYAEVAATLQAFINDPDTVLALIARGSLEDRLEDLRGMESVTIDIDPEKERLVPRPEPNSATLAAVEEVLESAEETIFPTYRELTPSPLIEAIPDAMGASPIGADGHTGTTVASDGGRADDQRGSDVRTEDVDSNPAREPASQPRTGGSRDEDRARSGAEPADDYEPAVDDDGDHPPNGD